MLSSRIVRAYIGDNEVLFSIPAVHVSKLNTFLAKFGLVWVQLNEKWYYMNNKFVLYEDSSRRNKVVWPSDFDDVLPFVKNMNRILHFSPFEDPPPLPSGDFYIEPTQPTMFSASAVVSILADIGFSGLKVGRVVTRGTGLFAVTIKKLSYNSTMVREFRFGPHAPIIIGKLL